MRKTRFRRIRKQSTPERFTPQPIVGKEARLRKAKTIHTGFAQTGNGRLLLRQEATSFLNSCLSHK
jgi:hypothetical protein